MGKIVVPNVYMDVEFLKDVATRYDLVYKIVRACNGVEMVRITREEIVEIFKLHEWSEDMVHVDLDTFRKEYDNTKVLFKTTMLPMHTTSMGHGNNRKHIKIGRDEKEPFPMNYFSHYFRKIVCSLYQIIGFDAPDATPKEYMHMKSNIQHVALNIVYYFSTYLVENMHKHLIDHKEGKHWVKFWWYSLLMHMILYKQEKHFSDDISLKKVEDDLELLVQCWT